MLVCYIIVYIRIAQFSDLYTVQASCRSLVVDVLPIPEQQIGSAWGMSILSLVALDDKAANDL